MSSSTFDKFYTQKDLKFSLQTLKIFCVFVSFFWLLPTSISGQTKCFTEEDTKKITDSLSNPKKVGEIKNIKSELLKIDSNRKSLEDNILKEKNKDESIAKRKQLLREGIQRLCTIFKENGWIKKDDLGQDGFSAEMDLIFNVDLPNIQREFLPILISAADKGEVKRADIATLVDSIRITSGIPQLFGTYLTFSDGIVYLYPLENEKMVDEWRKSYELPSLNSFMREIETKYQTLVIKRNSPKRNKVNRKVDTKVLGLEDDDETIKISTKLVNVKIRVIGKEANPIQNTNFAAKDFILSEDDKVQEISFFEKNKEPVDYYLILDLSGSTARIRETIWKTVGILAKLLRTGDRITVLTHFDGNLRTLLDLTPDQSNITETVSQFRGLGSSSVWDALDNTFDLIEKRNFKDRGAALILISDAIEADSKLAFGNLLNRIKENEIMIFPIQLPTDYLIEDPFASQKRLKIAGRAFQLLAEESGGEYFNIKKDNELLAIPEKIINGLGEIYSLGFEPNGDFDGSWRQLKVTIANKNDFRVRAKTGYYAKP